MELINVEAEADGRRGDGNSIHQTWIMVALQGRLFHHASIWNRLKEATLVCSSNWFVLQSRKQRRPCRRRWEPISSRGITTLDFDCRDF